MVDMRLHVWLKNFLPMKMHKLVASCIWAIMLSSCAGNADSDKKTLVVSIEPQRAVLERLAGPEYKVETMLARGANPETFDPSPAERLLAEDATLYFATGVLPFEDKLIASSSNPGVFVDTSKGVDLMYGTHVHSHGSGAERHEHSHTAVDPHYWSSIAGVREMASNMANALSILNPDSCAVYSSRLDDFNQHLDSLDTVIAEQLAPVQGSSFAVWHPSLSYFARDYGVEQLSVGQENKELSAKALADVIDNAKNHGVKVFFFQREYDSRQANIINEGIGSRLVIIDPLSYDWEGQLQLICDELTRPQ